MRQRSPDSTWVGSPALGAVTPPPTAPAVAAPVVVARNTVTAPVTVTDTGTTWILDNGIVRATVRKNSGQMSMIFLGTPATGNATLRGSGNWEEDPSAAATVGGLTQTVTIDPAKNDGERAEVAVKGVTGGKVPLTIGSPGSPNGTANIDLEIRTE